MNTTNITCPHCGETFEITEAIQHQLDDELQRAKDEQSKSLKKQYDKRYEKEIKTTTEVVVCTRPKRANYRLNP